MECVSNSEAGGQPAEKNLSEQGKKTMNPEMKAKVEEIMKASRIRELRMELDWYWKKRAMS